MQNILVIFHFFAVRFTKLPPFSRVIYRSEKRKINMYAHFAQLNRKIHSQQRLLEKENNEKNVKMH
jgi:hypothetical protein